MVERVTRYEVVESVKGLTLAPDLVGLFLGSGFEGVNVGLSYSALGNCLKEALNGETSVSQ